MWRRWGDGVYALLVFVVFGVQSAGLAFLTWAFLLRRSGVADGGVGFETALVWAVSVTAVALMVVTIYTLSYQAFSARRDRRRERELETWSRHWTEVLLGKRLAPPVRPSATALEALIEVGEELRGREGGKVRELLCTYEMDRALERRARRCSASRRGGGRLRPRRYMASGLEALDMLARAKLPSTISTTLELAEDRDPVVRRMALRAAATAISTMSSGPERASACEELVGVLRAAAVPRGVVEEALLLLEDAAQEVIAALVAAAPWIDDERLAAVLDAIGRLHLIELATPATSYIAHPSAEVRAAALRALGLAGYLPPASYDHVVRAMTDEDEIVRIQAVRAAYLLPSELKGPALEIAIGDRSWWVRRAASWAMYRSGESGLRALRRAAGGHPDRFGRHMAIQTLLVAGELSAESAWQLRRAG